MLRISVLCLCIRGFFTWIVLFYDLGVDSIEFFFRKHSEKFPAEVKCFLDRTVLGRSLSYVTFREVKDLTIKLSMVENSAYRLASNIKKTQKRANALKNITIPMYTNLVHNINNALEEKEREEFTRLKVIKNMKRA